MSFEIDRDNAAQAELAADERPLVELLRQALATAKMGERRDQANFKYGADELASIVSALEDLIERALADLDPPAARAPSTPVELVRAWRSLNLSYHVLDNSARCFDLIRELREVDPTVASILRADQLCGGLTINPKGDFLRAIQTKDDPHGLIPQGPAHGLPRVPSSLESGWLQRPKGHQSTGRWNKAAWSCYKRPEPLQSTLTGLRARPFREGQAFYVGFSGRPRAAATLSTSVAPSQNLSLELPQRLPAGAEVGGKPAGPYRPELTK